MPKRNTSCRVIAIAGCIALQFCVFGQDKAEETPSAAQIDSIQLNTQVEASRIVIKLTAEAPHRLLYNPGDSEAVVEFTGVSAQGYVVDGDAFDSLIAGIDVSEEALLACKISINLSEEVTNVQSFSLSQLPGLIVDVQRFSSARPLPYLAPLKATSTPEPVKIMPSSESLPAIPTPETSFLPEPAADSADLPGPDEAVGLDSIPAAAPQPSTMAPTSLFSEMHDLFPLRLAMPQSAEGQKVFDAFADGDYAVAIELAWAFFEEAEGKRDQIEVLALASEARYRYEMDKEEGAAQRPLNYYRQLRRIAPEGPLKAFAVYREAECLEKMDARRQAMVAYREALDLGVLPFGDLITSKIADLMMEFGKPGDVPELLLASIANYPESGQKALWLAQLGAAYFEQNRWKDASEAYDAAAKIDSGIQMDRPWMNYRRGRAAQELGQARNAAKYYMKFSLPPPDATVSETEAALIRLHVATFLAVDARRMRLIRDERVNQAISDMLRMIDEFEGLKDKSLVNSAKRALAFAGLDHKARDGEIDVWEDVPEYADPLRQLGLLLEMDIGPEEATRIGLALMSAPQDNFTDEEVVEIGRQASLAFQVATRDQDRMKEEGVIGRILSKALRDDYEAKRYLQGASLFKSALRYIPKATYPDICVYYGALCFIEIGAADEAIVYLWELDARPGQLAMPDDAVQYHLARAEALWARNKGADCKAPLKRLDRLLTKFPETPLRARVRLLMGDCHRRDGNPELTIPALAAALDGPGLLPEEQIDALANLGDAYASLGFREQAMENYFRGLYMFEELQTDFPDSKIAMRLLYGLAEQLHRVGDWEKAAMMFEQYLVFYPEASMAAEARYFLGDSYRQSGNRLNAEDVFAKIKRDEKIESVWRDLADLALKDISIEANSAKFGI